MVDVDGAGEDGSASDAFFAVDLECVLHKYRRWHECFPRVKPFYGEKVSSFLVLPPGIDRRDHFCAVKGTIHETMLRPPRRQASEELFTARDMSA